MKWFKQLAQLWRGSSRAKQPTQPTTLRQLNTRPTTQLKQEEMQRIVGGRTARQQRWNNGCGGIVPQ